MPPPLPTTSLREDRCRKTPLSGTVMQWLGHRPDCESLHGDLGRASADLAAERSRTRFGHV